MQSFLPCWTLLNSVVLSFPSGSLCQLLLMRNSDFFFFFFTEVLWRAFRLKECVGDNHPTVYQQESQWDESLSEIRGEWGNWESTAYCSENVWVREGCVHTTHLVWTAAHSTCGCNKAHLLKYCTYIQFWGTCTYTFGAKCCNFLPKQLILDFSSFFFFVSQIKN